MGVVALFLMGTYAARGDIELYRWVITSIVGLGFILSGLNLIRGEKKKKEEEEIWCSGVTNLSECRFAYNGEGYFGCSSPEFCKYQRPALEE